MVAGAQESDDSFDVVLIGGGNAGISAAGRLIRRGITDVAVIEPQSVHVYRPSLSYVGSGQATMKGAARLQKAVTPRRCTWLQDSAVDVDAAAHTVRCASGRRYRYQDVVLGPGLVPDNAALAGIDAALNTPAVASNYLDAAEKTWQLVQSMPAGGRAIFTVPRAPVSCTGITIKPLFLAAAHWARTKRLSAIDITLVIDRPHLLGVPDLDARLLDHLDDLGVEILHNTVVTGLNPDQREISVDDHRGGTTLLPYDFLHLVPPFRGPQWLQTSDLTNGNPYGLVDIDPRTFRHRTKPNVWAVGDGANVGTDPSGGALRKQVSTMVDNLLATRAEAEMSYYDGYTVAPIAISGHRLILGEFDRTGAISSSLPSFLDPLKPRRSAWAVDRYALPQVYWKLLLNGIL